ncbi:MULTISPECIES: PLP-dependent aminotransferase family protein [unclassified Bradyrhizobium]|uniref:MocR-like pyridoxine biosynthesis transcription factor PdxR n=2 Tax=Bradyrhizobium TaxID=374 RepID=UPI002479D5B0|nr:MULTISPECIES: PLP-dependent aminotransferase family protein [unclassified Bradyrhizobium]WGR68598.1 PLP-dependent aminotransferase family protein [Bradyrhizobium sp. ISRA426]WGR80653.1 PLP-dependent aminotransferase family protein [Bradyrhizobium sp. ISRA430]WGR83838.1 PLP-dependent aminotransferase family protein [Bradyrhizobium sp. ISRA432]
MVEMKTSPGRRAGRMGARQIYEALRDQILARVYGTDDLLPSSRALADEMGVARSTVTVAYEQLAAEGFIETRHGARPRVARAVVERGRARAASRPSTRKARLSKFGEQLRQDPPRWSEPPRGLVANFRYGELSPSDFPALAWKKAAVAAMNRKRERLAYDDPCGSLRLRTALQGYLWRSRTVRCEVDQIVVVNGSQQGLDICARLLLDAGDRFVMEDPGYLMARHTFAATGAVAIPIPVDQDGLETERLDGVEARLAYVTPSHQYPLGGVLPIGRRHQLLAWARRADACVIEDDYDSEYRYDTKPIPPLHALEGSDNVIYLGTISKTLSPTLRIGYLVVPSGLRSLFGAAKQIMDRHTPLLEQEALAAMLESGAYESHVRRVRRRNAERQQALLSALRRRFGDRVRIDGAAAGLHVVAWFDDLPQTREAALIEAARAKGVGIYPISALFDGRRPGRRRSREAVGLVMGYSALEIAQIEHGCRLLARAVDEVSSK